MCTANHLETLLGLARRLQEAKIHFVLAHRFDDAVTLDVAIPGQRWEIDCYENGTVEVEIFQSDGEMLDESAIERLFREHAD